MRKYINRIFAVVIGIFSFLLTILPEDFFLYFTLFKNCEDIVNIVANRVILFVVLVVIVAIARALYNHFSKKIVINGRNYTIVVQYSDIFEMNNCKKVIPFDECYNTNIGTMPGEIKKESICGQFVLKNDVDKIKSAIKSSNINPKGKSKFQNLDRYESGTIVPYDDYLLMAFVKLDKDGLGRITREEYIKCLSVMWKEIDKYHACQDVCIPILGSGVTTRLGDGSLTSQELVNIIINSYKLSSSKIKCPKKLFIVCQKHDGFSLNKIEE